MIFHASIPARNPERVAAVIAEIWGGQSFRFPPWPGAWVAMAGDVRGSMVEVYPHTMPMAPGNGSEMARPHPDAAPRPYACFHLAIATERSVEEILAIGRREGWRAVPCSRGGVFDVVELWLENGLMFEVLTPEMQHDYRRGVNLDMWRLTREEEPVPA
ncbi:hypothetical protein IA69_00025 [Massilia sp. JS1662]|nr:hypothetical protein [Massilia sp. JS1662]KGF83251.1 hypothetical protein IA69_00025 [Massilia sp. JS1662]